MQGVTGETLQEAGIKEQGKQGREDRESEKDVLMIRFPWELGLRIVPPRDDFAGYFSTLSHSPTADAEPRSVKSPDVWASLPAGRAPSQAPEGKLPVCPGAVHGCR